MGQAKKYRCDAEGAIYNRRGTLSIDDLVRQSSHRDLIVGSIEIALPVLRFFRGDDVSYDPKECQPTLQGHAIDFRIGDDPEVVVDAFEVLDLVHGVWAIASSIEDPAFKRHRETLIQSLANCSFTLGRMTERLAIRWEGFEAKVASKKRSIAALPKGSTKRGNEATIRDAYQTACERYPHSSKGFRQQRMAESLNVSVRTIRRRMAEYGIG